MKMPQHPWQSSIAFQFSASSLASHCLRSIVPLVGSFRIAQHVIKIQCKRNGDNNDTHSNNHMTKMKGKNNRPTTSKVDD